MVNKIHSMENYFGEYQKSIANAEIFWAQQADSFFWRKRWDMVVDWNFDIPDIKWFKNAKLNVTENIFEKNLYTHGNQDAIIWAPNSPDETSRRLTYPELFKEVNKFANTLRGLGVKKGDRTVYAYGS